MARITKEGLRQRAATAPPRETVTCGEDEYLLQGMTGRQRDRWETSLVVRRGKSREVNTENVRATLLCQCLINDDGTRLLSDGDAEWLGDLRADDADRLCDVAKRLSGIGEKDIEELGKPSTEAGGSGSPSS